MKLSEITGARAIDVIAELIQPLANIAGDRENIAQMFNRKPNDGETESAATVRVLKENLPVLLKTHRDDILKILSTIDDADPESISVPEIVKGTLDLLGDDDFMSLFMSAVPKEARRQPTKRSETAETSKPES